MFLCISAYQCGVSETSVFMSEVCNAKPQCPMAEDEAVGCGEYICSFGLYDGRVREYTDRWNDEMGGGGGYWNGEVSLGTPGLGI